MDWRCGLGARCEDSGRDLGRGLEWTGGVAFWALPGCKDLGCGLEAWSEGVDWGHGLG